MGFYDDEVEMALSSIKEYGQQITWLSLEDGVAPDSNKSWLNGPTASTPYSVYVAFVPHSKRNSQTLRKEADSDRQIKSVVGLVGQLPFIPKVKDVINRGGEDWVIFSIDEVNVNGEVVLYKVEFEA